MSEPNPASWKNDLDGVATPADIGVQSYPTLQWLSGNAALRGTWRARGHFFISADQSVECNWGETDFVTKSGEVIHGYAKDEMVCSIIRMRRAWFCEGKDGRFHRFAWNDYDSAKAFGKASGKMQIIISAGGIDRPVALTLRGNLSKHAVERNGWGDKARRFLYDPVAREYAAGKSKVEYKRLPSLCFWISIGSPSEPFYLTVGEGNATSQITPIELIDPADIVKPENMGNHIVSRTMRTMHEDIYSEASEWSKAWDKSFEAPADTSRYDGPETDIG